MLNRVVLMGRLCGVPELKTTNSGVSVTSFRIAVDRDYVRQGEERKADFFDIVAWRGTAEFICRNFDKGSMIAIDGKLQSRQYQTKEGQNCTAIEVVADAASFTGERREKKQDLQYDPQEYAPQQTPQYQPQYQTPQHRDPYIANPRNAFPYQQTCQGQQMPMGTPDGDLPF